MNPLITSRIDQIEHLCRANHVLELYTFGSINRIKYFNESSDIDFLVEFKEDEISLEEYAESYFNLTFGFEEIFEREIDITTVKSLSNPYFIEELENSKILIYSENVKING